MKHVSMLFRCLVAIAIALGALCAIRPAYSEASVLVKRIDFLEAALREAGVFDAPSGPNSEDRVQAVFKQYNISSSLPAYAVINTGVTSADMAAASRYGLSPDSTAIIAAAFRAGLTSPEQMPSKTDFQCSVNVGWAAGVLARTDAFMHGSTRQISEKYLSDEVDYYILYTNYHNVIEYIFDTSFYYEDTQRIIYSPYVNAPVPFRRGYTATDRNGIDFCFIDTVFKTKERTVTVPMFSDDDFSLVLSQRISDIGDIKNPADRRAFAEAYMRGLIRGESDGPYSSTRHFRPARIVRKDELPAMFAMLSDPSLRTVLSPDLKVTRDHDLPEAYRLYPYILDSFPNEYYDSGFEDGDEHQDFIAADITGTYEERAAKTATVTYAYDDMIFPFEMERFLADDSGRSLDPKWKNLTAAFADQAAEYYMHLLNTDYRTVDGDTEWYEFMNRYIPTAELDAWITRLKEEKLILRCDTAAADMSGVYYLNGAYHCKVYVHFMQEGDTPMELYGENDTEWGLEYIMEPDSVMQTSLNCSILAMGSWKYPISGPMIYWKRKPQKMNFDEGTDETNVWNDHLLTAAGIPANANDEVSFAAGNVRSTITSENNGIAKVREYLRMLGF